VSSAVVLLSSGLDSTVNLYLAHRELEIKAVLTFDYGQRAALRELQKSKEICEKLGLRHEIIELPWLKAITRTSLVNREASVPVADEVSIDSQNQSEQTAARVWVPNRNGAFLNIAAAFAESLDAQYVVPGFNVEEAATFADNSIDFLRALDESFAFSTRSRVQTLCFTQHLNKTQIAKLALQLSDEMGLDPKAMWPCYFAGESLCGQCESCQRFYRAFNAAHDALAKASVDAKNLTSDDQTHADAFS
jgi:7-cyano-7-deazaguanine synthase